MSEVLQDKAANITAPFTNGVADSTELLLSMGLTHAAMLLPDSWADRYIEVTVRGTATKSGWFLVSKSSTAEVDRSITAAADGAGDPKLGKRISVGESRSFKLPALLTGEHNYLINETDDATTTADISLCSH